MLNQLKKEANRTFTENGAVTYESTMSDCLDLFAAIGAIRRESDQNIIDRFIRAYAEDAHIAMKILFFGRDVRGGLGERRVFRVIINWLADHEPEALRKNIALIPEYGRFDDLLALMGTACESDALKVIGEQLKSDMAGDAEVSLLAKWLPSVNASNRETIRMAKRIAHYLGMTDAQYRKCLAELRRKIHILENSLREKDYSFDYSKQPSKAMFKYRKAFARNDGYRYSQFLEQVQNGKATLHTGTLMPYEVITPCLWGWGADGRLDEDERKAMDATWKGLEDFGDNENALVVIDGSGSMYGYSHPMPEAVALSLGIYFAERNQGPFHNHFITFSQNPKLVEIKGRDIAEKVRYCAGFNEIANTDLQRVFELILTTAIKYGINQEGLPKKIYIVSDMEFDSCMDHADMTNFELARRMFEQHGYQLPDVIFWNVASRNTQQPVMKNEQGVALVSGCTPRLFSMVARGVTSPYTFMMEVLESGRYSKISA